MTHAQKFQGDQPLTLDDLQVGQIFTTGTHRLERDELIDFASRYDPQPFHLDDEGAKGTLFGTMAASGWHTAAISMKLLVASMPFAGGIIGGGGNLEWPRPVRPGDTLHVACKILEITPSRSKLDRGVATVENTTFNQNNEVVQVFTVKLVMPRRVKAGGQGS
jgi:acyl dehydratase